jgi:non-heme chloroperoxidase
LDDSKALWHHRDKLKVRIAKVTSLSAEDEMEYQVKSVKLPTGVTLEYVDQGDPAGTPVLFLHGLSDSWHSFELVLPHLPESVRAIAVSQRGHGQSSHPEEGYGFDEFASDVAALLDALPLDTAFVVGHSLGSSIAQRFAIDHSDKTQGLVLVGSFFSMAQSRVPQELWESVVSSMEDPVDPDFVREFQESTLTKPVPKAFFDTIVQESLRLPARTWKATVAGSMEDDFSAQLNSIGAPTLIVWGNQDEMTSRSDQEAQMAAIAGSQLITYEGSGHAVHWEAPQRFASDLVAFVSTTHMANS